MSFDQNWLQREREAKQNYLKAKILDMGFSTQLFVQKCEEIKGSDIDFYTLEELKEVVKLFVLEQITMKQGERRETEEETKTEQFFPSPLKPNPLVTNDYSSQHSDDSKEEASDDDEVVEFNGIEEVTQGFGMEQEEEFNYTVYCKRLPETELSTVSGVKVVVDEAEVIKVNMFTPAVITYLVRTIPFGWSVKRKLSDFIWLRDALRYSNPGHYVPPIPSAHTREKQDMHDISRRRGKLQDFINAILRTPEFLKSPHLLTFLKDESSSEGKKEFAKPKGAIRLQDLFSISGNVSCNPSTNSKTATKMNEFLYQSSFVVRKIKKQVAGISNSFKQMSIKLYELAESLKVLSELQAELEETQVQKEIYEKLNEVVVKWGSMQAENANVLNDEFGIFFQKRNAEIKSMKQLLKDREEAMDEYMKTFGRLKQKKEKLWVANDISKWELVEAPGQEQFLSNKDFAFSKMLPKETEHLELLKRYYNYFNYQSISEIQRIFLENGELEAIHFAVLAKETKRSLSILLSEWSTLEGLLATKFQLQTTYREMCGSLGLPMNSS